MFPLTAYTVMITRGSYWGLGTGDWGLGTGDWGLGTGDWGLGTSSQSPVPNRQSPISSASLFPEFVTGWYAQLQHQFALP